MYTDYIIRSIQYVQTRQFGADEVSSPAGIVNNSQFRYIVAVDGVPPKTHDIILEINLDKDDGEPLIPLRIKEVFNIVNVRTLWGEGGREEFYSAVVEQRQILPGTFRDTKTDY